MSIPAVDFTLPDLHGGLTEIEGLAYLDDEFLVLDLTVKKIGGLKKEPKTIKIEPKALNSISLMKGLVRDKICLLPKSAELLNALPGQHLGEARLRTWRNHRSRAEALVNETRRRANAATNRDEP